MRPDLYRMFYPLDRPRQNEWAEIVQLPHEDYVACLADKAQEYDCRQEVDQDAIRWFGRAGNLELMLFRIPDPGNLRAVTGIYAALADTECPIAYAFVNQRGDHRDAWDVFQFSRLSYLNHCNRVSGPGSECEP